MSARGGLLNLTKTAFSSHWNPEDLDWSVTPVIPTDLNSDSYASMLSQLYYAELFALRVCGQLIEKVPDDEARLYLCTQAHEEAKHATTYLRYIERFSNLKPCTPALEEIFSWGIRFTGPWIAPMIILNIFFEAEALIQQKKRIKHLPCPLFKEISRRVMADESRHAAFGHLYVEKNLPRLSGRDREEVTQFIRKLWNRWILAIERKEIPPTSESLRTGPEQIQKQWENRRAVLAQMGLELG